MAGEVVSKVAVSVTEMARTVGLSRARFYQLVRAGVFPAPDHEPDTGRPFFGEDKQRACLEVRRRNCGVNGKAVLFYARRRDIGGRKPATGPAGGRVKKGVEAHADLIAGLAALNVTATPAQVGPLLKELFPGGTGGVEPGEVLRAAFLAIRRQNPAGSAGR